MSSSQMSRNCGPWIVEVVQLYSHSSNFHQNASIADNWRYNRQDSGQCREQQPPHPVNKQEQINDQKIWPENPGLLTFCTKKKKTEGLRHIWILICHRSQAWHISSGSRPCPPPMASRNRPKKDGCRMLWLIFHVSWPPLSELSGSATAHGRTQSDISQCNIDISP